MNYTAQSGCHLVKVLKVSKLNSVLFSERLFF